MKELETTRLILRKVCKQDVEDLFHNWSTDEKTTKFLTFPTHKKKEETLKFINCWLKKYENNGLEWVIELKKNHSVIGVISAEKSYKYKCIELGYSLSSKYWNQGIASEALNEVISFLFKEDYHVVEAIIPSTNKASIVVAQKCGMRLEATLKDRYIDKENVVQDLLVYSKFR